MIKVKPATNLQPVYFEWSPEFKIQLKDVPQSRVNALIKANEETTWNHKHERTTDTNWIKYGHAIMRESITGWVGLTYRILMEICRPFDLEPGVKLDDPIEFSAENLNYVIENQLPVFSRYYAHAMESLNGIYADQKRKELENL